MCKINDLTIANEDNTTIFSDAEIQYVVPLYQRAYAWKEKEILQLIDDICDCNSDRYLLGSLIVDKKKNKEIYEVIDGQQRLTTLYLLLKCLKDYDVKEILTFECRERSNKSLKKFDSLEKEDEIEASILEGKIIICKKLEDKEVFHRLKENLKRVKLYRIEVPDNTDLNRYFEIMNTRGEQLEQHDILKADLMDEISDHRHKLFAEIWNACSDMTGYVQMHFNDTSRRRQLFGNYWNFMPETGFFGEISDSDTVESNAGKTICDIINDTSITQISTETDEDQRIRFESIIDFPYFLLHTLRAFVTVRKIYAPGGEKLFDKLLDDKKLISDFDRVKNNAYIDGNKLSGKDFAESFIEFLLQYRYLFDKYIIKREFANDNSDGEWSLKELCTSGWGSKKKAYYKNTHFGSGNEGDRHSRIIRLQACYRVSYTSPKIMHWITSALMLCGDEKLSWSSYEDMLEKIAKDSVYNDFLKNEEYDSGVNTPHIVFNYLDYLIWRSEPKKYADFVFEFRNSVEHWYPQTPSKDSIDQWGQDEGVNHFGNLCLLQRNVNSKFSNLSPESKKSTFENMIKKGSLKLRIMATETVSTSQKSADQLWREEACFKHGKEMIDILRVACDCDI